MMIEDEELRKEYIMGIYRTVLLKDIFSGNKISDITLLKSIVRFLFDNIGHILENIVYLELIRRGYEVSIGKVGTQEIDFIAQSSGNKTYYQVSASILNPTTFKREISPLKKVNDHYPKVILSMDEFPMMEDGIKQINIVDFLLDNGL